MKILLCSHLFHPSVGGIEEVGRLLAREFVAARHEVRVVTSTKYGDGTDFPFEICRAPNPAELFKLFHWCDLIFHNNISLKTAWPRLAVRRAWVTVHHTWITRSGGHKSLRDRLKRRVLAFTRNVAVSESIAASLEYPCMIIGNPYNDELFLVNPSASRDRELIFVGRLVSDKGADLLIEALAALRAAGLHPKLTVVGDGPEKSALQVQAESLGVDEQVTFLGQQTGAALVGLLNSHRIIVIPSRWKEPFGLVALEGIASGCVVVGADSGGLPGAIGPCGLLHAPNNAASLATALARLITDEAACERLRIGATAHLAAHSARRVAAQYLQTFQEAIQR